MLEVAAALRELCDGFAGVAQNRIRQPERSRELGVCARRVDTGRKVLHVERTQRRIVCAKRSTLGRASAGEDLQEGRAACPLSAEGCQRYTPRPSAHSGGGGGGSDEQQELQRLFPQSAWPEKR